MALGGLAVVSKAASPARDKVMVIGHRGASALRPEHTLASYAKAIADGADMIEPDLVATKDGALVVRHENEIGGTTDVAGHPAFAGRKRTKRIDGTELTGWFTEDFTLAELKTLRATERLGAVRPESRGYDGAFQIVTFDEVLDFAAAESAARGRAIGVVPELKHSTYFAGIGLPLEDRFLKVLGAHRYAATAPILIQSFEVANLRYLRGVIGRRPNIRLVQLIEREDGRPADSAAKGDAMTYGDMLQPGRLSSIAAYADILSPGTRSLIPLRADGRLGAPTRVVEDAHAAGLQVCPYTFRPENRFLAADFRSDAGENARNPAGSIAEMRRYLALGLDALFTDDPALGRAAVDG
ncbi:glycerophosphodiester phosphodiesterase [Sphingomonas naphthae]|uniref:glycerophosphodiester phosphodiesterase n=1 Tax=Sphingomonas naphthae TaxID=1813468 RepID=A0ABY7TQI8_9SPHN|nr:glycerophosphodiester phosphodiesterase [Sphingomonas naphthae]WCT74109.1 glycerophosphodiester phosphodiesterase [Sphingomonas naphthae]